MRQYLIGSWNNADEYDYSGEQLMGHRLGASREVPHFLSNGQANVLKYGDNTPVSKKSSIHIRDKILPQQKRLDTLDKQTRELEDSLNNDSISYPEYLQLKTILDNKRNRAWELYVRATRGVSFPDELVRSEYKAHSVGKTSHQNHNNEEEVVGWLSSVSDENMFKNHVGKALHLWKKVIHYKHKATTYIQSLKEL